MNQNQKKGKDLKISKSLSHDRLALKKNIEILSPTVK